MTNMNRILIVDDHAQFRFALREFLSQEPDFEVVGEAGSTFEALRSVAALSPDLVLTDLAMPGTHGVEAVTQLKRRYPDMKVLVVSLHGEEEFKYLCRKAGAAGYIEKDAVYSELRERIRAVLSGKTHRSEVPALSGAASAQRFPARRSIAH